jgi:hypothetical protein
LLEKSATDIEGRENYKIINSNRFKYIKNIDVYTYIHFLNLLSVFGSNDNPLAMRTPNTYEFGF